LVITFDRFQQIAIVPSLFAIQLVYLIFTNFTLVFTNFGIQLSFMKRVVWI